MKKSISIFFLPLLISCTSNQTEERPAEWLGNWKAKWETLPESYPTLEDMEFYMDGNFIFSNDSLIVKANGFDGCIFNSDTLTHTQSWFVSNDTLFLINDPDQPGMIYTVKSKSETKIKLQLMNDIFVTLTK